MLQLPTERGVIEVKGAAVAETDRPGLEGVTDLYEREVEGSRRQERLSEPAEEDLHPWLHEHALGPSLIRCSSTNRSSSVCSEPRSALTIRYEPASASSF